MRSFTSYVCNFELVGWDPNEAVRNWGYASICTRRTVFFHKILRIIRSVLSIQLCLISPGEMEFNYMQAEAHSSSSHLPQAIWYKYMNKYWLERPLSCRCQFNPWWPLTFMITCFVTMTTFDTIVKCCECHIFGLIEVCVYYMPHQWLSYYLRCRVFCLKLQLWECQGTMSLAKNDMYICCLVGCLSHGQDFH